MMEINLDTIIAQLSEDLNDLDEILKFDHEAFESLKLRIQQNHQKMIQKNGALTHFQEMRKNLEISNNKPEWEDVDHILIGEENLPPGVADSIRMGMKEIDNDINQKIKQVKPHGKKNN